MNSGSGPIIPSNMYPTSRDADGTDLATLQQILQDEADLRVNLGARCRERRDFVGAELHWQEAARAQLASGQIAEAAAVFHDLAYMAMENRSPKATLAYVNSGIELYETLGSLREKIQLLTLRAEVCSMLNDIDAARVALEEASAIANVADLPVLEAEAYTRLIEICLQQNNVTAAASMAVRALDALVTVDNPSHYMQLGLGLTALLCRAREYRDAAAVLAKCESMAGEFAAESDAERIDALHAEIETAPGDFAEDCARGLAWTMTEFVRTMGRLIRRTVMPINVLLVSVPSKTQFPQLTPREREILVLLTDGCSTGAMAEQLCVSRRTVTTHLAHIMAKLGVSTRAELVAKAMRT